MSKQFEPHLQYEKIEPIEERQATEIFLATIDSPDGEEHAVAAIKLCKPDANAEAQTIFHRELLVTQLLIDHPQPHLIDVYLCDLVSLVLVEEWVENTSLEAYLQSHSLDVTSFVLHQMFEAMREVYTVFEFHGDIKKMHFLLAKYATGDESQTEVRVKLTDFGLANARQVRTGTPDYVTFEDFNQQNITDKRQLQLFYLKRDQFGFYVTIFELLFGHLPFGVSDGDVVSYFNRMESGDIDLSFDDSSVLSKMNKNQQVAVQALFKDFFMQKKWNTVEKNWINDFEKRLDECFDLVELPWGSRLRKLFTRGRED